MKKLHKYMGGLMLIPLLLWAITGLVFLIKPGYSSAYEQITPTLYSIDKPFHINGPGSWSQIKLLRTVLGYHLLVLERGQWKHLDPSTLQVRPQPTEGEIRALVQDAIATNGDRYDHIVGVDGFSVHTATDVVITLDWNSLSLRQKGADTRLIDTLYRIHYLQWFGSPVLDKMFGFIGLFFLAVMTCIGFALLFGAKHDDPV